MILNEVLLHDCTSRPHPLHVHSHVFLCFHEVDSFLTHKFLSFVVDHNVCFKRTQTWRNKNTLLGLQCSNSKATHPE